MIESVSHELEGKDLAGSRDEGLLDSSLLVPTGATANCKVIQDAVKFPDTEPVPDTLSPREGRPWEHTCCGQTNGAGV